MAESLGNLNGSCDGCASGRADMYQEYIEGKRELREINMEFRVDYSMYDNRLEKSVCGLK